MEKNIKYTFLLFILPFILFAQGENNIWPLNIGKILDFNHTPPLFKDIDVLLYAEAPKTSVCNANGDLLFYSDRRSLYDKNFQITPNGHGLIDDNYLTAMPVLSVPMIGEERKYYLFTLNAGFNLSGDFIPGELRYSIIDMSLNNSNGDIVEGQKNKLLQNNLTGRLVAAQGLCGSVWVLSHELNTNRFLAFEITEAGISSPVVSEVGRNLEAFPWDIISSNEGMMWFSPNYEKLALFGGRYKFVELFDFNRFTGKVSNPITLPIEDNTITVRSGCFSPDSEKLYVTEIYRINNDSTEISNYFQFDLSINDSIAVQTSKTLIETTDLGGSHLTQMQLGPDNIIYISEANTVAAIFEPNKIGPEVDYRDSVFVHSDIGAGGYSFTNPTVFPNDIYVHPMNILPEDQSLCSSSHLSIDLTNEGESYFWQDGSSSPTYQIETPGTYWVNVQNGNCTFTDTIVVRPLTFDIGANITHVSNEANNDGAIIIEEISGGTAPYQLDWSNGQSGYEIQQLEIGIYTVTITDNEGCVDIQNFVLDLETNIETSIENLSKFWVSPNPSKNQIKLHFSKKRRQALEVQLIDVSGQMIQHITLNPSQSFIDINTLSAGFYMIQARINKEVWRTSFIKI